MRTKSKSVEPALFLKNYQMVLVKWQKILKCMRISDKRIHNYQILQKLTVKLRKEISSDSGIKSFIALKYHCFPFQ